MYTIAMMCLNINKHVHTHTVHFYAYVHVLNAHRHLCLAVIKAQLACYENPGQRSALLYPITGDAVETLTIAQLI